MHGGFLMVVLYAWYVHRTSLLFSRTSFKSLLESLGVETDEYEF